MFELLLLIYLLPVIFVAALLLKLALWLVKKIFYCCPIKSIKYKKCRSAIVYSMVEYYFSIASPIKK